MKKKNVYNCLIGLMLVGSSICSAQTKYSEKDGKITTVSGKRIISGVYPHLTTYAHARINGQYKFGDECGIGALAVWGDKLYMVNYAAHCPKGSEHQLYILDKNKKMTIYPGSVGGTPAARMIHAESEQLLIGHYLIDKKGNIRTIPILTMPGRITAIARHLEDPANKVYYYDMEGMLYEANVHTLEVKKLYNNPLPGWHGKGAYTAQGKLVMANNGEAAENTKEWQVPVAEQMGPEKYGVLAEYDGNKFKVVERKQFTDVTTRHGIQAVPNDNSPLWSMGWDKKAVRLKVMEKGVWSTYLLPKATYNNDPSHGWFTEWPRIREIGENEMMMDMHGMFFDFPATFSSENSAGIRPIASHLRYIPDFCRWNDEVVLATDETSIQGNQLAGQPQSNLWFGTAQEFKEWGPATGYGAIWLDDAVKKGAVSEPYLFAGFDRRIAHIVNHETTPISLTVQIDERGDNQWEDYQTIRLKGGEYQTFIFPEQVKGEWIRLKAVNAGKVSFVLHYTTDHHQDGKKFASLFDGLAEIGTSDEIITAKLFSNRANLNLSCFTSIRKGGHISEDGEFEFRKFKFDFVPGITDSLANKAVMTKVYYKKQEQLWSVDDASVVLHTSVGNLRLPKGNAAYDKHLDSRCIREVESERELANIHGTFYELPLFYVGNEPLFTMMRPVSSHNLFIDDYNSWNGLLVMSGVRRDAKKSDHIYKNKNNTAALWFGSIDDLWKLGKPVGVGGPWKNTSVKKDVLSDPYLMTGYDKKTLILQADKDVTITLWVSISHYLKQKFAFKEFKLKAGEEIKYVFPKEFSAHWVYLSADKDCSATGQFIYE